MLHNIHLTTKVFGSLLVAIIGMLIIAISSYVSFNKIGLEIIEIAEYQVPINKHITELEANIIKEEALTYELLLESTNQNTQNFKDVKGKLTTLENKTDAIILKAEELVSQAIAHNKKEQAKQTYSLFLKELKVLEKEQKVFKEHLAQLIIQLDNKELHTIEQHKQILHHDLTQMDSNIVQLMHQMEELLEHSTHQAEKDEQQALVIIEIISVIVIIISLLLSYLLLRYIKQKFRNFQNSFVAFFDFLNRKSSDVVLADDKHTDEFGSMSKVLNINIEKAKAAIEEDRKVIEETIHVLSEFEQGDLCQRVSIESNNPSLLKLTQLLNQMGTNLEHNIDDILTVLEEYTNDNYLNRVNVEGLKEHLLRLSSGINTLGDAITESLQTRKRNALTLQSSANTLKRNVQNLSTSSNEAATSLEETAAALEEITSTSVRNSENITSMASYASQVTHSSNQGEKLANETMSAMDEINDEVNSINEAITVIDQIAFQTNILSLNAAVEAATAGEAGKGFAVVAQEVRNLASRSAEAAKEIKELVETATVKANSGKEIAQNMLNGYESLNSDIEKTLQLINSVDDASKEQKMGIEQINDAVTQLDQQTQRNSAAALETNDIAITTEKLSETMLASIDTNQFEGKSDITDRRSQCRDLNYQGEERRRAEQTIKQTRAVNNTSHHQDKEWESF